MALTHFQPTYYLPLDLSSTEKAMRYLTNSAWGTFASFVVKNEF